MKKLLLLSALVLFGSSGVMAQSSPTPPSGMSEIQAYSIFYENYKNESYEGALQFGRWIWKGMPETIKGYSKFDLRTNLDRFVNIYGALSKKAQDPALAEAYADTALMIFDKIEQKYGDSLNKFEFAIDKGRFYQSHSNAIANAPEKAAEQYMKAFELQPEKFTKMADGYYVQALVQSLMSEDKKDKALAIIDKAEPYASSKLKDYFSSARNKLFDSPEERIAFLESELKKDPKNVKVLNQLQNIYEQQDMTQKLNEVSKKLYEINPNYENALALGESAMSDARYDEAIQYFKEALDKAKKAEQKAAIALNISRAYSNQDQLQSARRYARMAARNDSDWGKPYIQIADIYAQAVSECTENRKMEVEDRVVYWLVLDYLNKAQRVDSSVSNEVDRKKQAYAPVTPSTEQIFFKNWKDGQQLTVDSSLASCYGWINETTTVRR